MNERKQGQRGDDRSAGAAKEHADLQDGSLKQHGDVLDPLIPRGADQKGDDDSRVSGGDRPARGSRES